MEVFNLLNETDKELITEYITKFGFTHANNNNANNINLEAALEEWSLKKGLNLSTLFDNQLILRRPYTYTVSVDGIANILNKAIRAGAPQYKALRTWFERYIYNVIEDITPVSINNNTGGYYPYKRLSVELDMCFCAEWLAKNSWLGDDFKFTFPDGEVFKICSGMKIMKILHKFVEKYHGPEDSFELFRNWHSTFLNQKYLDGELCLSIHPLDFMTMSDNDNDWTSCMRWSGNSHRSDAADPGDYRAGTVECMNSPYIIIAYLHNPDKPMIIDDDFSWNNKKWRELFIIHPEVINEIKGYPYQDENLTNTCLMWIKELASKNLGWVYDEEEIDVGNMRTACIKSPEDDSDIFLEYITSDFMYNDIGTLPKHRGRVNKATLWYDIIKNPNTRRTVYTGNKDSYYIVQVPYGGIATCVCCGATLIGDESAKVVCDDCEPGVYCAHCGRYLNGPGDTYWIEDYDDPICTECYDDECSTDDLTGEMRLYENMTTYRWLLGYDKNNVAVFYDETFTTGVDQRSSPWTDIFMGEVPYSDYSHHIYCPFVTLHDVRNLRKFYQLFDWWDDGVNLQKIYNEYGVDKYFYPLKENQSA